MFFKMFLASSPRFIMSILVKQPIDLWPVGSISLIILRASLTARSWFAGMTQRMMDLGSEIYLRAIFLVIS